jgi:hypothetical protein
MDSAVCDDGGMTACIKDDLPLVALWSRAGIDGTPLVVACC